MKKNISMLAIIFAIIMLMNTIAYIYVVNTQHSIKSPPFLTLGGNPYASDALYFRYPAKSFFINGHFFYPQSQNPNFESYVYGEKE